MGLKLIIDGNAVYEIDEDCIQKKRIGKAAGKDFFENDSVELVKQEKIQKENAKRRNP